MGRIFADGWYPHSAVRKQDVGWDDSNYGDTAVQKEADLMSIANNMLISIL